MSLKPLKVSDQKRNQDRINAKMQKQKRELIDNPPPYMYIISEGIKTEPNYISELVKAINIKYFDLSSGVRILVQGTGRNTQSLLTYARRRVDKEFPLATVVCIAFSRFCGQ